MDKEYWNKFYEKHKHPFEPSPFSKFIMKYVDETESIIDLGCGNGRDSLFFYENKLEVTAIDQSENIIMELNRLQFPYFTALPLKFEELDSSMWFDHAYSRFTLHSVEEHTEDHIFDWVKNNVCNYFFIEVRSDEDSLVNKTTDHYRRFLNFENTIKKVIDLGFKIVYAEKSRGFSVYDEKFGVDYNENDPILIRMVLKI
jgi:2-polyprenyl-3-methyl-5-hydroxy-6-metoxy-1,4-benzoquinol methylase